MRMRSVQLAYLHIIHIYSRRVYKSLYPEQHNENQHIYTASYNSYRFEMQFVSINLSIVKRTNLQKVINTFINDYTYVHLSLVSTIPSIAECFRTSEAHLNVA